MRKEGEIQVSAYGTGHRPEILRKSKVKGKSTWIDSPRLSSMGKIGLFPYLFTWKKIHRLSTIGFLFLGVLRPTAWERYGRAYRSHKKSKGISKWKKEDWPLNLVEQIPILWVLPHSNWILFHFGLRVVRIKEVWRTRPEDSDIPLIWRSSVIHTRIPEFHSYERAFPT